MLKESCEAYFGLKSASPYMLLMAPVNEDRRLESDTKISDDGDMLRLINRRRSDIPAVTHVDYSARIQTVAPEEKPDFYAVIKDFEKLTGYGSIVNTSFNVRGEPIVNTPEDALNTFSNSGIDVLVMGNYLLDKE